MVVNRWIPQVVLFLGASTVLGQSSCQGQVTTITVYTCSTEMGNLGNPSSYSSASATSSSYSTSSGAISSSSITAQSPSSSMATAASASSTSSVNTPSPVVSSSSAGALLAYTAAATTTNTGTLPSASACYSANTPACSDIDAAGVRVDDSWLGPALCAYANANPAWLASRAPCAPDGNSGINVTIYDPTYDDDLAIYVPYEEAQAEGLIGDANGFAWWPAAWRMAAVQISEVTGSIGQDDIVNGNMTIGLELVGGKGATVQAVGAALNVTALASLFAEAPGTPTVVQTSSTATTLMGDTFYVVMNFTGVGDGGSVFLDGLNGQWQYYDMSNVFPDISFVAQGQVPS
ncbi:hypothetical protein Q5752_006718 [Cryptotrichosporon argae]